MCIRDSYSIVALVSVPNIESPTTVLANIQETESEQKVVFDTVDDTFIGKINSITDAFKNAKPSKGLIGDLSSISDSLQKRTLSRNYSSPDSTPSLIPDYRRIPDTPG